MATSPLFSMMVLFDMPYVADGSLEKIAENRDEFCRRIDESDSANNWLMIPLVDSLVKREKSLRRGAVAVSSVRLYSGR